MFAGIIALLSVVDVTHAQAGMLSAWGIGNALFGGIDFFVQIFANLLQAIFDIIIGLVSIPIICLIIFRDVNSSIILKAYISYNTPLMLHCFSFQLSVMEGNAFYVPPGAAEVPVA